MAQRIVFHVDFDYFFAALEELRNPSLKGKPVVVCVYSGREDSGAVATANYAARELGIKSGMPNSTAMRLGKGKAVFIPADKEYYRQVSDRVMQYLKSKAKKFEQVSIDEAYIEFTGEIKTFEDAAKKAEEIKSEIKKLVGITRSIGIGHNKLVAKMASKEKKPDGLTVIRPEEAKEFLFKKPVSKLYGVGPKSLEVLEKLDIKTIKELAEYDVRRLSAFLGERKAKLLWERANAIDYSPVEYSERQQISRIATLEENTRDMQKIKNLLNTLAKEVYSKLKEKEKRFKTVSIIAINTSLKAKTRSKTLETPSDSLKDIVKTSEELMERFLKENPKELLRRCGITVSSFEYSKKKEGQKSLSDFYF